MDYSDYFSKVERPVETCVVGSGGFGRSFLAQGMRVPLMRARVAVDVDAAIARRCFVDLGVVPDAVVQCSTADEAARAWAAGHCIAAADLATVIDLPIDVVVEATGHPEAGARHAQMAIAAGRHVVLVSKEVDSVVGPVLAYKAQQRGCVSTPVDGDQPSLLIGLISWARLLGLEILAAGKSSEYDFVYDPLKATLSCDGRTIDAPGFARLWNPDGFTMTDLAEVRAQACGAFSQRIVADLCELQVVANATGLRPDRPDLHAPIARVQEVPEFLALRSEGGLFSTPGGLDVFHCLRRPDEVSFAGGVFVVVRCDDAPTWQLLAAKGHVVSRDGRRGLLYLPRHLLGLEAATSVLDAAIHGRATGGQAPLPSLDLVARAVRDFAAGEVLVMGGHHHTITGATAELHPALPEANTHPVPYYLAANRTLRKALRAGDLVRWADIEIDSASVLYRLRRNQDEVFFT